MIQLENQNPANKQEIAGHKLSDAILERLPTLCTMNPGRRISYSEVIAFHNIIREMDAVERIISHAMRKSKDGKIDLSDFLNEAAGSMRYGMFTPMEVRQHGIESVRSLIDRPTSSGISLAEGVLAPISVSVWPISRHC